jgi:serpin B
MHLRFAFAAAALGLSTAAACSSTSNDTTGAGGAQGDGAGGASGTTGPGGAGGRPDVPQVKSPLARVAASDVPRASVDAAVTANNAFAVDLYSHVRGTTPGANLLTSPLSAELALTMTYAGARGQTKTEMATALHFAAPDATIFEGQNALMEELGQRASRAFADDAQIARAYGGTPPSKSNYQLEVVNSVWGDQSLTFLGPFLDVLASDYGTGVYVEDFIGHPEPTRQTINDWVSAQTDDRINDLLPDGSLDTALMVLVNAIHVKLHWQTGFHDSSEPSSFAAASGSVATQFMAQSTNLPYLDDGDAQIVGLPLAGGQVSVVIALPHGDLGAYEDALAAGAAALKQPTDDAYVALSMPKTSFTSSSVSLATSLAAMGMPTAFQGGADFTGICAAPPIQIEDVLQKTMIDMEEDGVEAAAATAVILGSTATTGVMPTPVPMTVDRPFVVAIVDVPTNAILFLGHIGDPKSGM